MKTEDLKQVIEFAGESREILLSMLMPLLDEKLTDQPVEAYAVYLANVRWAAYEALEALSRLERLSTAALPLWSEASGTAQSLARADHIRRIVESSAAFKDLPLGEQNG